jgi:RNA 2',3'-cyclic 3'-phosphodiesterase
VSAPRSARGSGAAIRRAFVAVRPPTHVVAALDEVLARVRGGGSPGLTWTPKAQWHVTLQFLGPVADVDALVGALTTGLAATEAFKIGLGGAGAFPVPDRASVVWVGVDLGADDLERAAATVVGATGTLGFTPEEAFTAHLTVARARRPCPVASVIASIGDAPFGSAWDVTEVLLMESDTRPNAAVHRELARFALVQP